MNKEPEFCDICSRPKEEYEGMTICKCLGIWSYTYSAYPGEHCLVKTHPNNGGEQYYKREDVEALLEGLNPKQIHNFCHNLEQTVSLQEFCQGCSQYQKELYGKSAIEELEKENKRLKEIADIIFNILSDGHTFKGVIQLVEEMATENLKLKIAIAKHLKGHVLRSQEFENIDLSEVQGIID